MSVTQQNTVVNRPQLSRAENIVISPVCFVAKDIVRKGRIPSLSWCYRWSRGALIYLCITAARDRASEDRETIYYYCYYHYYYYYYYYYYYFNFNFYLFSAK